MCQCDACLDVVDRMNKQVRLLNSLFRLVGRANNELVGSMNNRERMINNKERVVQFYTKSLNTF